MLIIFLEYPRGVPAHGGVPAGNEIVTLKVDLPKRLTERQSMLLKEAFSVEEKKGGKSISKVF